MLSEGSSGGLCSALLKYLPLRLALGQVFLDNSGYRYIKVVKVVLLQTARDRLKVLQACSEKNWELISISITFTKPLYFLILAFKIFDRNSFVELNAI